MKRPRGQRERELERWSRSTTTRPAPHPPAPGQESVWDYPRPPRVDPVPERLRVELRGEVLADTTRGLRVLETAGPPTYYFPPDDVRSYLLRPSSHETYCEWKGYSVYWNVAGVDNVAWSYPDPYEEYASLTDAFAFFAGRVDACWVGPERVRPQPGEIYGGWVTDRLVGPFKGEPGSDGW